MRMSEIRSIMCDEGWPYVKGGKKQPPNPLACVECDSMCLGGVEYLKRMKETEFQGLLCGADCDTCRQPCNLRRIAIMRRIKPVKVIARAKPKRKTWLEIAMRPYYERNGGKTNAEAD